MASRPRRTAQSGKDVLPSAPATETEKPKRKPNTRTATIVSTADHEVPSTQSTPLETPILLSTMADVPDIVTDKPKKKRKAPAAKKTLATSSTTAVEEGSLDANEESLPKVKKIKAAPPTPSKSNPSRNNRVSNPGGPDKKRSKRTSAEVVADKEKKEQMALKLVEVEKQKILLLAAMEVDDEEAEDEELLNVVRNRDDREVSPETFLFDEVDAEPSEEEEDDRGGKNLKATATKAKIGVRCMTSMIDARRY